MGYYDYNIFLNSIIYSSTSLFEKSIVPAVTWFLLILFLLLATIFLSCWDSCTRENGFVRSILIKKVDHRFLPKARVSKPYEHAKSNRELSPTATLNTETVELAIRALPCIVPNTSGRAAQDLEAEVAEVPEETTTMSSATTPIQSAKNPIHSPRTAMESFADHQEDTPKSSTELTDPWRACTTPTETCLIA